MPERSILLFKKKIKDLVKSGIFLLPIVIDYNLLNCFRIHNFRNHEKALLQIIISLTFKWPFCCKSIHVFIVLSIAMIIVTKVFIFHLLLLINSSYPAFVEDDLLDFLEDQGLQELSAGFVSEEIEVSQLPSMPDDFLVRLGITTMGGRLRLRSAATAWLTQESGSGQVNAFSDMLTLGSYFEKLRHTSFRWMSKAKEVARMVLDLVKNKMEERQMMDQFS